MKKIAIITIWDLGNYGNRLQNYAVTKLAEKLGYRPNTIVLDKKQNIGIVKITKYFIGHLIFLATKGKAKVESERIFRFFDFTLKRVPYRYLKNKHDLSDYDYVFIGSDQVWNPKYVEPNDYIYGKNVDSKKVVCIAPSFGVSYISEDVEKMIKPFLEHIELLNVRESDGAKIIKKITGRDVPVIVDPTLLLTSNEWKKVEKRPVYMPSQKYILKYFLGEESEKSKSDSIYISKKYGYEIIELLNKQNPLSYVAGPSEFIYLIHNAEMIITDSFHACVFSIIFKRPFWVYERNGEKMNSRLETLFSLLNIEDRFEHNMDYPFEIDYSNVDDALNNEREKVNNFLNKAIN